jgi:AcrR family transcriptional regulator
VTTRGEARKEQIFSVGARLFAQKGYERTSLQEVADLLGLTKPALYYYYASKEELLFEIMSFVMESVLGDIREVAASAAPPVERLAELVRRYVSFFVAHPHEHTIMSVQVDSLRPELRDRILAQQREYLRHVRGIVAGLLADGDGAELDETSAAFALLGGMNWIFKWYHPEGRVTPEKLAHDFCTIYSRGLASRPDPGSSRKKIQKPTTPVRQKEKT